MQQVDNSQVKTTRKQEPSQKRRLKIMVINWKWDREPEFYHDYANVPTFWDIKEASKEMQEYRKFVQNSFKKDILFDPVKSNDSESEEEAQKNHCLVFPIRVDMRALKVSAGKEHIKQQESLINRLEKSFQGKFKEYELEILYLFHKSYQFDERRMQTFINASKKGIKEQKFYVFGNAMGPLYNLKKGLLDSTLGEYSLPNKDALEFTPFYENEDDQFKALKQENFDFVWDEYWYETGRKIMWMREKVFESLLPNYEYKKDVQDIVGNYLFNFERNKKQKSKDSQKNKYGTEVQLTDDKEMYSFSSCNDLEKFKLDGDGMNGFIKVLEEYVNGRLKNKEEDTLIRKLNSMAERVYAIAK